MLIAGKNFGRRMVTFVPDFVSQRCRDWERDFLAELDRRGVSPGDQAGRRAVRDELAQREPRPSATLSDVADHVDHVRSVAGAEHVGLGGDYDGVGRQPDGLRDVSGYPDLIAELARRGWSEPELAALTSGNILRVLGDAETAAVALAARRGPSGATIEELDGAGVP